MKGISGGFACMSRFGTLNFLHLLLPKRGSVKSLRYTPISYQRNICRAGEIAGLHEVQHMLECKKSLVYLHSISLNVELLAVLQSVHEPQAKLIAMIVV